MSFLAGSRFIPTVRVTSRSVTSSIQSTPTARSPWNISSRRSISSTARRQKGPVNVAKDTLKKADKVVSGAAVKGIEKGEQARDKIKDVASAVSGKTEAEKTEAEKTKGKEEEALGEAKRKAKDAASHLKS
ncbi:hypothetical protein EYZ11_000625 [Aspergillus tanneri]|uniref:LEA domain protein n=1 Tax=Aspergillus tanneri TaxID=1220188 RepID=A0A4S3JWV4_9EURO|nr:hypothetical protein EYZ11_000625 [Aspergillus tanneri]